MSSCVIFMISICIPRTLKRVSSISCVLLMRRDYLRMNCAKKLWQPLPSQDLKISTDPTKKRKCPKQVSRKQNDLRRLPIFSKRACWAKMHSKLLLMHISKTREMQKLLSPQEPKQSNEQKILLQKKYPIIRSLERKSEHKLLRPRYCKPKPAAWCRWWRARAKRSASTWRYRSTPWPKRCATRLFRSIENMAITPKRFFVPAQASDLVEYMSEAIEDGLKRLLIPSLEREFRADKKRRSDEAAIKLFGENLRQLLLTPPVRWKVVLGFDPAFRTWCKLAVVDATGKFLAKDVIYPTPPQSDTAKAETTILKLIKDYKIELIVIGNGTWSRESTLFVQNVIKNNKLAVQYMIVSEAGASVYSASALAQQEYPELDVTIRWAISIAHRVQDPLAELTKIEPKAIGVWQYQHDVDQKLLSSKLDEKVEDVVNSVGVDLNTASATLLQYIAWLTPAIAKNIVLYRDENWPFTTKAQLKKVKWLWPKAYEQCVGFLRIQDGKEPLDATGIHPEMYAKVYALLEWEYGMKKGKVKLPVA